MPAYISPDRRITIILPSSDPKDPARIVGPGELDYWDETRILSKTQHNEQDAATGQPRTIVDNAMFEYLLVHTWLEHAQTSWNLFDERGVPLDRDTPTINRIFKGPKGRADRMHIAAMLAEEFFPDMIDRGKDEEKETQPGNAPEEAVSSPTPVSFDTGPSVQATSPSFATPDPIGSMPLPEARPAVAATSPTP